MHLTDTLVIDLDDTLYLERDFVHSGFREVGQFVEQEYGVAGFGGTCWDLFADGIRGRTFDVAAAIHAWDMAPDDRSRLISLYRSHTPSIGLAQVTREALQRLSAHHRMILFTGGFAPTQQRKVDALRLGEYFDDVILTGALGPKHDKPDHYFWRHVEKITRRSKKELTCVGDNPLKDIRPSLSMGWCAIRVRLPNSLHSHLPTPAGASEIQSFEEILRMYGET